MKSISPPLPPRRAQAHPPAPAGFEVIERAPSQTPPKCWFDAKHGVWCSGEFDAEPQPLLARLHGRIFSPDSRPVEPIPRFYLAGTPICTPGNLTAISAQAKAGKSAAIGAMLASTFATDGAECLGFTSANPDGLAVVHLDTEQSLFDHWTGIQRAIKRARVESAPPWLMSYCLTGFSHADVRASIRALLELGRKTFGGVHSLFIDGVADCVADVNDISEVGELITKLHGLAIEFDAAIVNVIHVNPGSESKTRGHLGSQLERKSESNLRLERDEDGITVIWSERNRRAPIAKKSGPCFAWDDVQRMHVPVNNPSESAAEARTAAKLATMREDAGRVFAEKKHPVSHGELVTLLAVAFGLKPSGARRRIENWLSSQIVSKDVAGLYTLTP